MNSVKKNKVTTEIKKEKYNKEISYQITLTEEQKKVKTDFYTYDINFVFGDYGSGKTAIACLIALDSLFKKQKSKIIIARPIDFTATGFIPGDMPSKLEYHLMPIMQNLYTIYNKEKITKLISDGAIQMLPIDYMRGLTFQDAVVIIDEINELSYEDFELILTRLGKDSKIIFTGSKQQIRKGFRSCIENIEKLENSGLVGYNILKSNHRNDGIQKVLDYLRS